MAVVISTADYDGIFWYLWGPCPVAHSHLGIGLHADLIP